MNDSVALESFLFNNEIASSYFLIKLRLHLVTVWDWNYTTIKNIQIQWFFFCIQLFPEAFPSIL